MLTVKEKRVGVCVRIRPVVAAFHGGDGMASAKSHEVRHSIAGCGKHRHGASTARPVDARGTVGIATLPG